MHDFTHASFFSGIDGIGLGFERVGWRTVSHCEIDPYASAVLRSRWPEVPNIGDVTGLGVGALPTETIQASIWSGGFPCQDISVAGRRAGLYDAAGNPTRSGLAFAFLDLVREHRPLWVLLENVPGLLSSNKGRDLALILDSLADAGYVGAYRLLDSQFHGVAQRRRRVFILATRDTSGNSGAHRAAKVLSIGQSGSGHSAPRDAQRPGTTSGVARSITATSWKRHDEDTDTLVERIGQGAVGALTSALGHHGYTLGQEVHQGHILRDLGRYPLGDVAPTLRVGGRDKAHRAGDSYDNTPYAVVPGVSETLNSGGNDGGFRTEPGAHLIAFRKSARVNADPDSPESWVDDGLANTLNNFDIGDVRTTHALDEGMSDPEPGLVRRLTPTECEILQGFPPGWTIPLHSEWKYEDDPEWPLLPKGLDSNRYRVLGNAVTVNVAQTIAEGLTEEVRNPSA